MISTSVRTSFSGSAQALTIRADELFKEALTFVNLDQQEEAERALESAISLLGKSHNVSAALSEGQAVSDPVLAHYFAILAFTKQSLEKYEEADIIYRATLPTLSVCSVANAFPICRSDFSRRPDRRAPSGIMTTNNLELL